MAMTLHSSSNDANVYSGKKRECGPMTSVNDVIYLLLFAELICIALFGRLLSATDNAIYVPDPPSDVIMTSCDARVVQIQWRVSRDNGSPITQFTVEYNTSFRPDVWRVAKSQIPGDRTYERIAISPWGNYSFRVVAQNTVGASLPSAPTRSVCSTPPDVPHINPRRVCTLNVRPHALVIHWQLLSPEEYNAPGFHYLVKWRRRDQSSRSVEEERGGGGSGGGVGGLGGGGSGSKTKVSGAQLAIDGQFDERAVDAGSDTLTVEGQSVYKSYDIYVIAVNEIGEAASLSRLVIGYSGEDVPLEVPLGFHIDPAKQATDTTVDLVWNAVNTNPWRMQGFFRGYKVQLWKTDDIDGRTSEDDQGRREHVIIYRESPSTCWRRDGGRESSVDGSTDGMREGRWEAGPQMSSQTGGTVALARRKRDANLRDVKISRDGASSREVSSSRDIVSAHIYNLWPFTNVTAHVMALNSKYEGPQSLPITFITAEGVPGLVQSFKVVGRGSRMLRLVWEKPTVINGIFVGYSLTYTGKNYGMIERTVSEIVGLSHGEIILRNNITVTKKVKSVAPTGREVVVEIDETNISTMKLKDLQPLHRYRLSLSARTRIGRGQRLDIEATTLADGPPPTPNFTASVVGKMAVNVTWFSDEDEGEGQPATSFAVHYRRIGHLVWTLSADETDRKWIAVDGLDPESVYEMKVVSRNGEELESPQSSSVLKRVRLGAKKELVRPAMKLSKSIDTTSIKVGLTDPDHVALSFYVQYRHSGLSELWSRTENISSSKWTLLKDLRPGVKYDIRVIMTLEDAEQVTSVSRVVMVGKDPDAQASVGGSMNGASQISSTQHLYETQLNNVETLSQFLVYFLLPLKSFNSLTTASILTGLLIQYSYR